jgi:hypothetical protein
MAKGKNDPTGGNDYLEQLQWQARHRGYMGIPKLFGSKGKYKIVYRLPHASLFGRILHTTIVLGIAFVIYQNISDIMTNAVWETKLFYGVMIGIFALMFFFAIRDISKDSDNKSDR